VVDETDLTLEDTFPTFRKVFASASYASYGHLPEDHRNDLTEHTRNALEHGASVPGADFSRSLLRVDQLRRPMENLFDRYDLLLNPTMPVAAFPNDDGPSVIGGRHVEPFWRFLPLTFLISMSGQTASSLPCGFTTESIPIGLHIVEDHGTEFRVLRASAAFEEARPWSGQRPPVS
jgi:aspartyl-tRNA(Asn)/glutamyl-tRNA(Gln) amidotransferase subunit A